MILVLTYRELAMVAGTTTTALVLGIGAFAICVLPWFRSKSQGNGENQEGERIEMTVDPGSRIEENSISSSMGFRGIFLRASDWVRAAMMPKLPAAKIQFVGNLFREGNSTIERPILMAQRFNQFQFDTQISKENVKPDFSESYELVEMKGDETRTTETPDSVTAGNKKYSRDSPTVARREPVAHSTWKNIGPLLGSNIYSRQQFQQRNYEDPRITKESSLNLREARGSRIEEIPLDLSVQTASRLHANNFLNSDIRAEKESAARLGTRKENSSFIDENGNDGGSDLKRKVFRDMLDFLRLKKASRKRHKASERSDSIKFCQILSSSFPRAKNENIQRENTRKNISTGSHEILELKNSETSSSDRGFSRKFKKIFDSQIYSSDTITRLEVNKKNMQIDTEPVKNTPRDGICFSNNNCDSTSSKMTEFENISSYLKMGNLTSINKECIEPCTEL